MPDPKLLGNLKVKSNLNWRPFIHGYDVPEKVLKEEYDHLEDAESLDGFLYYKGNYYHRSDFLRVHRDGEYWPGAHALGYTTGLVIRASADLESYQIGTYSE